MVMRLVTPILMVVVVNVFMHAVVREKIQRLPEFGLGASLNKRTALSMAVSSSTGNMSIEPAAFPVPSMGALRPRRRQRIASSMERGKVWRRGRREVKQALNDAEL